MSFSSLFCLMFMLLADCEVIVVFVLVCHCVSINIVPIRHGFSSLLVILTTSGLIFRSVFCLYLHCRTKTYNNHGPQTPPSQIRPQGTQEQAPLQETPPLQAQGQEALSPPPQEEVLFRLSGNDFLIICKPDFHPGDSFSSCSSY